MNSYNFDRINMYSKSANSSDFNNYPYYWESVLVDLAFLRAICSVRTNRYPPTGGWEESPYNIGQMLEQYRKEKVLVLQRQR
ncbi:MAG: hypothetical protein ABWZ25_17880 [Chitinophagaceae bacterium]